MAQTDHIIGAKKGLAHVMERVHMVATKDIPVLLYGETGCGKEVVAQLIHERSKRSKEIFRRVNCGAIPPELIDSELFGHERGAFTGTTSTHLGWFEQANNGTLLLDEVGELSLPAQVRLLRVLQDGTFNRVGGEKNQKTNVRIIAATHRNLPAMIEKKLFREDLYYRLAVFPIVIPPLRERKEDIPALAEFFITRAVTKFGIKPMTICKEDIAHLQKYPWPGNIREFASVIDRAVLLGEAYDKPQISLALGTYDTNNHKQQNKISPEVNKHDETLDAVIRNHIEKIIYDCHGRIEGPFGAAIRLGINPSTLRSKIRKWK